MLFNMDLEASIVDRLQKLRQWQIEQQERLLMQQQMQRELLTHKQDCMYKALELSIQGLDLNDSTLQTSDLHVPEVNIETGIQALEEMCNILQIDKNSIEISDHKETCIDQSKNSFENFNSEEQSPVQLYTPNKNEQCTNNVHAMRKTNDNASLDFAPTKQEVQITEFMIDGVAPLPLESNVINHISIDDVPIPSPKKDFHTLLEERLRDCESTPPKESNTNAKVPTKKTFLRKGQGLSRFRLNGALQSPVEKIRQRSMSLSTSAQSSSKGRNSIKPKDTTQSSKNVQLKKGVGAPNLTKQQLCLKNVPLPVRRIRSKSESDSVSPQTENQSQPKNEADLNTSDFQTKTQKEMEEVRIFELLEEKAENSSFCSTSSTVVAFLQQSTPFKIKKKVCKEENNINMKHQDNPLVKAIKNQVKILNGKHQVKPISAYTSYNRNNDLHQDSISSINLNESLSSVVTDKQILHDAYTHMKTLKDTDENNKLSPSIKKHGLLRNHVRSMHSQQNYCDRPDAVNSNELDVSLHVRFSEYNEYKTIGSTDTSIVSNDSSTVKSFCDDKIWNDSFTPETSDTEMILTKLTESKFPPMISYDAQNGNQQFKSTQCNVLQELNYKRKGSVTLCQDNDFLFNDKPCQNTYQNDRVSEFSGVIDQSSEDEESILIDQYDDKNVSFQEHNNSHVHDNLKSCIENNGNNYNANKNMSNSANNCNDETVARANHNEDTTTEIDRTIFKSELLKSRLLELEQEIDIFRKENTALALQRQKMQEDHKKLHKEFIEKEKCLEECKRQAEDRLQEERKKLARQKSALESRLRDSQEKAQQNKLERQEVQNLRQELESLQEEISVKESRWNAVQSRQKCQMRILKTENTKLKQEVERLQNLKKVNVKNKGKSGTFSNAKAIHQISKQINMQTKEVNKVVDNSSSDGEHQPIEPIKATGGKVDIKNPDYKISDKNKYNVYETLGKSQQSTVNIVKKRNLYENLLKEATSDFTESVEKSDGLNNSDTDKFEVDNQTKKLDEKENDLNHSNQSDKNDEAVEHNYISNADNIQFDEESNSYVPLVSLSKISPKSHHSKLAATISEEFTSNTSSKNSTSENSHKIDDQGTRCIQHEDGHREYWYSNGNVKKLFPDQGLIKMIYYNGDVRETDKSGKVKYFYASTRTWHTTMPDGVEILEFPDGQVEKRLHNGTAEVTFPDGSIRILESDGSEKWILTDGTIVHTFANGEKILTLPNGQREIHTKAHKRREYPDGTVKLVYPDGTQETRYSNGRTRLKDKDGNLLMDMYQ